MDLGDISAAQVSDISTDKSFGSEVQVSTIVLSCYFLVNFYKSEELNFSTMRDCSHSPTRVTVILILDSPN